MESNYIAVVLVPGEKPVFHLFTFHYEGDYSEDGVDMNVAAERYAIKHYSQDNAKLSLFEQWTDNCTGGISS